MHISTVYLMPFKKPETWQYKTFCQPDGIKNFLLQCQHQERDVYATKKTKAEFLARMSRDGFDVCLAYYRAMVNQIQSKADTALQNRHVVDVPILYVGATEDYACPPVGIKRPSDAGLLPQLSTVILGGGHWAILPKPEESGRAVVHWLDGAFC